MFNIVRVFWENKAGVYTCLNNMMFVPRVRSRTEEQDRRGIPSSVDPVADWRRFNRHTTPGPGSP